MENLEKDLAKQKFEEAIKKMKEKIEIGKELEKQIIRAKNWEQLFPSKEEAEKDFLEKIIKTSKIELEENRTLKKYKIKPDPNGDLHIFEYKMKGYKSTCQKLKTNGNVKLIFEGPNKKNYDTITPEVGNINHNFTNEHTILPNLELLRKIDEEELEEVTGSQMIPGVMFFYMKGTVATKKMEKIMLENGYLPQRIGHRIYPDFILKIQAILREKYPNLYENPN